MIQKSQRPDILPVFPAQGRIDAHIQPGLQSIAQSQNRFLKASFRIGQIRPGQMVVYFRIFRIKGDLHAVQAGVIELSAQLPRKPGPIGIQAGDEPARMLHQLRQILPHGRLPSGKSKLADSGSAAPVDDFKPFLGGQLLCACRWLSRRIAVPAFQAAVPFSFPVEHGAYHKIHPMRRRHIRRIFPEGKRPDIA